MVITDNTMKDPLVTVLLPNYNNGPYLKDAIQSLLNQTFQDFIIYFVDDCSTDNSIEIAESFHSDKIRIFRKPNQSGIIDTLNIGLKEISSKYFIRMDGDDLSTKHRFEKLVGFMEMHPEIAVCTSNIKTFGLEEELIEYEVDPSQNKANLIFSHTIGHSSSIFRTLVLRENNIQYESNYWRMEDYDLFYRMKDFANYSCLPEVLYLYRRGEYNVNNEIRQKMLGFYKLFYASIFDELRLPYSEDLLQLHCELGGSSVFPSQTLKHYRRHVQSILNANGQSKIFPQKELRVRLNKALIRTTYILIDLKKIGLYSAVRMALLDKKLIRYYLARRLRGSSR